MIGFFNEDLEYEFPKVTYTQDTNSGQIMNRPRSKSANWPQTRALHASTSYNLHVPSQKPPSLDSNSIRS